MDDSAVETRNHKFSLSDDDAVSRPATSEEIESGRRAFSNPAMRSCWECNHAHRHFLRDGSDFSMVCFGCGRYFHDGVDITSYERV